MYWVNVVRWLGRQVLRGERTGDASAEKPMSQHPPKLTCEDVLRMIEENGSPEGLDLSGQDLSWIDLGSEVIRREAGLVRERTGEQPVWQNERHGGINLRGVNLAGASLLGANLAYADLRHADMEGVMLAAAILTRSWLHHANLRRADLSRARLTGSWAMDGNFEDADLAGADLTDVDFRGASLRRAGLHRAFLSGTKVSRRELGSTVLQEKPIELEAFLARHIPKLDAQAIAAILQTRQLEDARQVYANLKANFLGTGNYEDASWAHVKERQIAKRTHSPKHAKDYYGDEFLDGRAWLSWGWWKFYLRHTAKWLLDSAAELTCGYGERPLRTVTWAGVILLVFPFLYAWSGGLKSLAGSLSWLDYFNYSLGAFTTIGFGQFEATTPLAQTLTSLQALLGISVLALLMFALGNRISRS